MLQSLFMFALSFLVVYLYTVCIIKSTVKKIEHNLNDTGERALEVFKSILNEQKEGTNRYYYLKGNYEGVKSFCELLKKTYE